MLAGWRALHARRRRALRPGRRRSASVVRRRAASWRGISQGDRGPAAAALSHADSDGSVGGWRRWSAVGAVPLRLIAGRRLVRRRRRRRRCRRLGHVVGVHRCGRVGGGDRLFRLVRCAVVHLAVGGGALARLGVAGAARLLALRAR